MPGLVTLRPIALTSFRAQPRRITKHDVYVVFIDAPPSFIHFIGPSTARSLRSKNQYNFSVSLSKKPLASSPHEATASRYGPTVHEAVGPQPTADYARRTAELFHLELSGAFTGNGGHGFAGGVFCV